VSGTHSPSPPSREYLALGGSICRRTVDLPVAERARKILRLADTLS
jgi:hypothetical protein